MVSSRIVGRIVRKIKSEAEGKKRVTAKEMAIILHRAYRTNINEILRERQNELHRAVKLFGVREPANLIKDLVALTHVMGRPPENKEELREALEKLTQLEREGKINREWANNSFSEIMEFLDTSAGYDSRRRQILRIARALNIELPANGKIRMVRVIRKRGDNEKVTRIKPRSRRLTIHEIKEPVEDEFINGIMAKVRKHLGLTGSKKVTDKDLILALHELGYHNLTPTGLDEIRHKLVEKPEGSTTLIKDILLISRILNRVPKNREDVVKGLEEARKLERLGAVNRYWGKSYNSLVEDTLQNYAYKIQKLLGLKRGE